MMLMVNTNIVTIMLLLWLLLQGLVKSRSINHISFEFSILGDEVVDSELFYSWF